MNLLNLVQNSPVIQWAILLLSASSLVLTLTLAVKQLILQPFSILTKSQKTSLTNFLKTFEDSSTTIFPILSEALKTVLTNKNLLPSQNLKPEESQTPETIQETTLHSDNEVISQFLNFINSQKEVKK